MKKLPHLSLLLALLCFFLKTGAQDIRNAVIQEASSDSIVVEFENYSYLIDRAPSATTLHSWSEVTNANASGGSALQAGGGSVDGGDPLMIGKVKFDIYFATSGSYYLYLRVLASHPSRNSLCVPSGFNKPSCTVLDILPVNPNFQWVKVATPYNVLPTDIGDILTLTFFPNEEDIIIDKWVLEQTNNLTDAQLDALAETPQQLPLPPQGVIGVTSFESLPFELPINEGASSNYDSAVAFPGVVEDYFPYVGLQFLHMDQTGNDHSSGNSTIVFKPILIDRTFVPCYNALSTFELCFRWFSPAAVDGLFEAGDIFRVDVEYFGIFGSLGTENLLIVQGDAIDTDGQCYEQTCTTLAAPMAAAYFVLTFSLVSDDPLEDIWVDQVSLETTPAYAPKAVISDCVLTGLTIDANSDNSDNATHYIWYTSDGVLDTILNAVTPPPLNHTFASDGTYLVCLVVANTCLGYHIDCKLVTIVTPLPVELTTFTGKQEAENVLLNWTTQTETNNSHFIVEHSTDNVRFTPIGRVDGAGNSQEEQQYQFLHQKPGGGTHYYRLLQVDFDGQSEYSDIVSVALNTKPEVQIFPNPFKDQLQFEYDPSLQLTLQLFDINGRLLFHQSLQDVNQVELAFLNAGLYYVQVLDKSGIVTSREKLVKMSR